MAQGRVYEKADPCYNQAFNGQIPENEYSHGAISGFYSGSTCWRAVFGDEPVMEIFRHYPGSDRRKQPADLIAGQYEFGRLSQANDAGIRYLVLQCH